MPALLNRIRPQWQGRSLIERVGRLISVDPSSACQRLFNAAIHDLKEKVVIAGLDIASEAAKQNRLPSIARNEDVEGYSTFHLIELCYRMGLLSRPEYRRLSRCYEIRRDLEHEDDEYEAGLEDCIYIFSTCIEAVLSKDPVQLVRVTDFKDLIGIASPTVPNEALLEDFANAPLIRQEEIGRFLISKALDKTEPDLVQQNAFHALGSVALLFQSQVRVNLGTALQEQIGRELNDRRARVANAAGLLPYVRQAARGAFFENVFIQWQKITSHWSAYDKHGEMLRSFIEYGSIDGCLPEQRYKFVLFLVLTFVGEPGGRTSFGNVRNVFNSNTASPLVKRILTETNVPLGPIFAALRLEKAVQSALTNTHLARRFEELYDIALEAAVGRA